MYCRQCGKELPDDAYFCSACGMRLTEEDEYGATAVKRPHGGTLTDHRYPREPDESQDNDKFNTDTSPKDTTTEGKFTQHEKNRGRDIGGTVGVVIGFLVAMGFLFLVLVPLETDPKSHQRYLIFLIILVPGGIGWVIGWLAE